MNYFIKEYISLFLENKKSFLDFYNDVRKEKEKEEEEKEEEKEEEEEEKLPEDPYYYLRPGVPKTNN